MIWIAIAITTAIVTLWRRVSRQFLNTPRLRRVAWIASAVIVGVLLTFIQARH